MAHTCKLNSTTEAVTVTLTAHGLLNSSGSFGIFDSNATPLESWEMQIDQTGTANHVVKMETVKLPGCTMTWEVSTCSMKPEVTSGSIEITVKQTNPCIITPPVKNDLMELGQCSDGDYTKTKGQLTFTT